MVGQLCIGKCTLTLHLLLEMHCWAHSEVRYALCAEGRDRTHVTAHIVTLMKRAGIAPDRFAHAATLITSMITCTNVRRLHGLLAGFNVYSEPSWPCLTFNRQQKYFPPGVERRSCSQGGEDRDRGGSRFDVP